MRPEKPLPATDPSTKLIYKTERGGATSSDPLDKGVERSIMAAALPSYTNGGAFLHGDTNHVESAMEGGLARVGSAVPDVDDDYIAGLEQYSRSYFARTLVPLSPTTDTTPETYLSGTNYSMARQEQLLNVYYDHHNIYERQGKHYRFLAAKSFIKAEFYDTVKFLRTINSRTDRYKVETGRIFSAIEREVFKDPWFIKKVPQADRPQYIKDLLDIPGSKLFSTDFSRYEASFKEKLQLAVEIPLFEHMTQHLPESDPFMKLVRKAQLGMNRCQFRNWLMKILSKRLSGEMCTSLGNSTCTKMCIMYLAFRRGSTVVGVVEGDDSLFVISGEPIQAEDFSKLGLIVKMEEHVDFSTASFCGLVFDPIDVVNVTDPRKVLCTYGWADRKYLRAKHSTKMGLLRCKALSIAHQYPGCPILGHLARHLLLVTRSHDTSRFVGKGGWWEREKDWMLTAKTVPFREPPIRTRLLVERLYGISLESQRRIERYLDGLTSATPLRHVDLDMLMKEEWKHYWDHYMVTEDDETPTRGFPAAQYVKNWAAEVHDRGNVTPGTYIPAT